MRVWFVCGFFGLCVACTSAPESSDGAGGASAEALLEKKDSGSGAGLPGDCKDGQGACSGGGGKDGGGAGSGDGGCKEGQGACSGGGGKDGGGAGSGAPDCGTLEDAVNDYLDASLDCTGDEPKACTTILPGLCCDVVVADPNLPSVAKYLDALDVFNASKCFASCPKRACDAKPVGVCEVDASQKGSCAIIP